MATEEHHDQDATLGTSHDSLQSAVETVATTEAATKVEAASARPVFGWGNLLICALLFVGAMVVFLILQASVHINSTGVSIDPHYVYQAESFLHGHLSLYGMPTHRDLIYLNHRWYNIYPPMPALMLMPFVAVFGVHTSDILFTAIISALDLPILFLLFEQVRANGLTRRGRLSNVVLAALFFFGSINLWLSLDGKVWFTEQIVTFFFVLLCLLCAFRRLWILSAICLACAFLTRGTLALAFPLLLFLAWYDARPENMPRLSLATLRGWREWHLASWRPDWRAIPVRRVAPVVVILGGAVLAFMVRNALAFGSPFETGYTLTLKQNYPLIKYGAYSPHYFWMNLIANFFDFPHITFKSAYDLAPQIDWLNGAYGTCVFFTTPLFLFLFWRNAKFNPLRAALWVTIVLVVVQALLYDWSGASQFGTRYLFDAFPFAFLLLVLSDFRVDWRVMALGIFGVYVNVIGAYQFWTFHKGLPFL